MSYSVSLIMGYLIGCFQTSYLLARWTKHIDIRNYGSGNAGSTNALRVLGWKYGALTFAGDLFKGVLGVLVCKALFDSDLAGLYAGLGVVFGHNWPVFLKFKGGKGIASTLGLMLAFDIRIGLIAWAITAVVILTTKYVSLGSLLLITLFPIGIVLFHQGNRSALAIGVVLMAFGFFKHTANIKRLLKGNENKLGHKKPSITRSET